MIDAVQYLANKKRLQKAEALLDEGDKWNSTDPKHIKWREEYSRIMEDNLEFESFHKMDWAATKIEKKKVDEEKV